MKQKSRKAFTALKDIGAPVFEDPDGVAEFKLSAESNDTRIWADYYNEIEFEIAAEFGREPSANAGCPVIHKDVMAILDRFGLFAEWQNAGCVSVHTL